MAACRHALRRNRQRTGEAAKPRHRQRAAGDDDFLQRVAVIELDGHRAAADGDALVHRRAQGINAHGGRRAETDAGKTAQGCRAAGDQRVAGLAERILGDVQAQVAAGDADAGTTGAESCADSAHANQQGRRITRARLLHREVATDLTEAVNGNRHVAARERQIVAAETGAQAPAQTHSGQAADRCRAADAAGLGRVGDVEVAAAVADRHRGTTACDADTDAARADVPGADARDLVQNDLEVASQMRRPHIDGTRNRQHEAAVRQVQHRRLGCVGGRQRQRARAGAAPVEHRRAGGLDEFAGRVEGLVDVDGGGAQVGQLIACHADAGQIAHAGEPAPRRTTDFGGECQRDVDAAQAGEFAAAGAVACAQSGAADDQLVDADDTGVAERAAQAAHAL